MILYLPTFSLTFCARTVDCVTADYGSFTLTCADIFTKIILGDANANGLDQVWIPHSVPRLRLEVLSQRRRWTRTVPLRPVIEWPWTPNFWVQASHHTSILSLVPEFNCRALIKIFHRVRQILSVSCVCLLFKWIIFHPGILSNLLEYSRWSVVSFISAINSARFMYLTTSCSASNYKRSCSTQQNFPIVCWSCDLEVKF